MHQAREPVHQASDVLVMSLDIQHEGIRMLYVKAHMLVQPFLIITEQTCLPSDHAQALRKTETPEPG